MTWILFWFVHKSLLFGIVIFYFWFLYIIFIFFSVHWFRIRNWWASRRFCVLIRFVFWIGSTCIWLKPIETGLGFLPSDPMCPIIEDLFGFVGYDSCDLIWFNLSSEDPRVSFWVSWVGFFLLSELTQITRFFFSIIVSFYTCFQSLFMKTGRILPDFLREWVLVKFYLIDFLVWLHIDFLVWLQWYP